MSDREEKLHQLRLAIRRVETGRAHHVKKGAKLNILTVATEASLSASTIHTRYPEIAELIREKMGKASRAQRDQKQGELKTCQARNRELLEEIADLKRDLASVASRYATAAIRLKQLEASNNGAAPMRKTPN
jgi:cell division protein FtsB